MHRDISDSEIISILEKYFKFKDSFWEIGDGMWSTGIRCVSRIIDKVCDVSLSENTLVDCIYTILLQNKNYVYMGVTCRPSYAEQSIIWDLQVLYDNQCMWASKEIVAVSSNA